MVSGTFRTRAIGSSTAAGETILFETLGFNNVQGRILCVENRYGVTAETMSVQSMKLRKNILGGEHRDMLNNITMVGSAYMLRARWGSAE